MSDRGPAPDRARPAGRAGAATLGVAGVLALAAAGCGEAQGRAGTNTNWLRLCTEDADCGAALACACGRCTVACAPDGACADHGGTCATVAAAALQCRDGDAAPLCLGACSAAADCAAEQLCFQGACVDALPPQVCATVPGGLACADFEEGLDGTPVVTEGNSLELSGGDVPSGAEALAVTVALDGASVAYLRSDMPAVSAGTLYLRAWIQVLPGAASYNLAPVGLWASGDVDWALRLVLTQSATELWSYTTPAASDDAISVGEWHCVEGATTLDDAAGSVSASVDGEARLVATGLDTLPAGGVDGLVMGTVWASGAASVRVDRVALATSPIGCWD